MDLRNNLQEEFLKYQKPRYSINLTKAPEGEIDNMEHYITKTTASFTKLHKVHLPNLFRKPDSTSVLIYGARNTCKSTVTQMIARSWASGDMWDDRFDLAFRLECRRMRSMIRNKDKLTLVELLVKYHFSSLSTRQQDGLQRCLQNNQERVLIMLDGLDELDEWDQVFNDENREIITRVTHSAEVHVLLYNIISGKLVPDTHRIITSRPIESIDTRMYSEVILASGFDRDGIDECSFDICGWDKVAHTKIEAILNANPNLYTYCTVPLNCMMCCQILHKDIRLKGTSEITSLSHLSVRIMLDIIGVDYEVNNNIQFTMSQRNTLCCLARLAANSLLRSTSTLPFTTKDLSSHGIENTSERIAQEFLHQTLDNCQVGSYTFSQLSMQEFLAAIHVSLSWKPDDVMKVAKVDYNSTSMDNIRIYVAGLLGDINFGHSLLKALDMRSTDKTYNARLKELHNSMTSCNGFMSSTHAQTDEAEKKNWNLTSQVKVQWIRCAHEVRCPAFIGKLEKTLLTVKKPILPSSDEARLRILDLQGIEGGILPHELSSIGYFAKECKGMNGLK